MAKSSGSDVPVSKGKLERMPRAATPFGAIDRLFDDFFGRRWPRSMWEGPFGDQELGPNVDIIDRDDEVLVRAEVPGYRKEDIECSVSGNMLTLKGETTSEQKQEEGDYYRSEISHGSFMRTITLPAEVDDSKAKATMKDGLLELKLPKLEASKRKTIQIS